MYWVCESTVIICTHMRTITLYESLRNLLYTGLLQSLLSNVVLNNA
jgi:hypothetical protein